MCVLYSFMFNFGQIPDNWRVVNIMPIFKKDSSTACSSYHLIPLTSYFCKLFDRIMKESVLDYLLKIQPYISSSAWFSVKTFHLYAVVGVCK